jgi:hypothetical protein
VRWIRWGLWNIRGGVSRRKLWGQTAPVPTARPRIQTVGRHDLKRREFKAQK